MPILFTTCRKRRWPPRPWSKVPFVVSFSSVLDESAAYADLILPSLHFLELWQDDILEGTGYYGISLRQPVVLPVRNGRNPGDVLLQIAKALGGTVAQSMPWDTFEQVVRERVAGMDISWDDLVKAGTWSSVDLPAGPSRAARPGARSSAAIAHWRPRTAVSTCSAARCSACSAPTARSTT